MGERNTTKRGIVRTLIFREAGVWYGVALEFGIVVDAETKGEAFERLSESAQGHLEAIQETKLKPTEANPLLNRTPDPEYETLWSKAHTAKKTLSSITEISRGTLSLV